MLGTIDAGFRDPRVVEALKLVNPRLSSGHEKSGPTVSGRML
ncbi:hypothetical protein [Austwickia sp. TVS 96-490-7B]|nr:hypothetical protein [Austwickia sp. TVS 96-490-7B]